MISNRCMPCRMIAPYYDELSQSAEFGENTLFLKVDVDEVPEIAEKFHVLSMPTFLFLQHGEVVERFSGASAEKLHEVLHELNSHDEH